MKYIIKLSTKGIAYALYIAQSDYTLKSYEQEVDKATFQTMPIPCKLINNEWVKVTADEYPTTDEMPDWVEPEIIEPTPEEKRKEAYETLKLIVYTNSNGEEVEWTVDDANAYYYKYLPELGIEALDPLHVIIKQAKDYIESLYPDPVTMSLMPIESGFKMKEVTS